MRETPTPEGRMRWRATLAVLAALVASGIGIACAPDSESEDAVSVQVDARPHATESDPDAMPDGWLEDHPVISPNAQLDVHWAALAERARPKDPRDGAGRVWVEQVVPIQGASGGGEILAASRQRVELTFEVAESGIDEGGLIFFQPDPFWSWSEAQTRNPKAPGYTTARAQSEDVELVSTGEGAVFEVRGRALRGREKIELVYGAGPSGARVDAYAETGAPLFLGVDASGDGTRGWLKEPARIDVKARPAQRLISFGPADIAEGEAFEISVAFVDGVGNRADWPAAVAPGEREQLRCEDLRFRLTTTGTSLPIAASKELTLGEGCATRSRQTLRLRAPEQSGTLRLQLEGLGALRAFSAELNPIVVRDSNTRLVWADLHGHSRLSDGTGTPEAYFAYARDIARLDAVALTDHDHWGLQPLDEAPALLQEIRETTNRFNQTGEFVTIQGYEWTNWVHGHRHVLSFDETLPFFSALDPETDRPDELWAALRGQPALTFAHHSAGEPIATNWFYRPDPILEPVTEIASVHGMSEAADAPAPVRGGEPGYFVRDTLLRGDRLGFIGSGDSHDGHPGLAQIASGQAGLAGLMTSALDRPALLESLRRRHTFATNGIRPFLEVHLDRVPMGGILQSGEKRDATEPAELELSIRYEATAPIQRIDLIRSGRIAQIPGEGRLSLELKRRIPALAPGEFHYVRIVQEDGGVAWSSPIFVDPSS